MAEGDVGITEGERDAVPVFVVLDVDESVRVAVPLLVELGVPVEDAV